MSCTFQKLPTPEIAPLLKQGRRFFGAMANLYCEWTDNDQLSCFQVIIPGKLKITKPQRNKIKRRYREIIKNSAIPKNGLRCLVVVQPRAIDADFKQLVEDFSLQINKAQGYFGWEI